MHIQSAPTSPTPRKVQIQPNIPSQTNPSSTDSFTQSVKKNLDSNTVVSMAVKSILPAAGGAILGAASGAHEGAATLVGVFASLAGAVTGTDFGFNCGLNLANKLIHQDPDLAQKVSGTASVTGGTLGLVGGAALAGATVYGVHLLGVTGGALLGGAIGATIGAASGYQMAKS